MLKPSQRYKQKESFRVTTEVAAVETVIYLTRTPVQEPLVFKFKHTRNLSVAFL